MDPKRRTHGTRVLWALICLAAAYSGLLRYFGAFTGQPLLDGGLGVMLGLYICSHPAANAVDLFFLDPRALHDLSAGWPGLRWLGLNGLTMLAGWFVIFLGATRFASQAV